MFRKISGVFAGMLVCMAVFAAGAQLRHDHPDTYTVRRGDTLWGISAKFLAKPWLWPEIWQANPQVRNPHLLYPGDVLNLSLSAADGPTLRLEPSIHHESDAVPAIPLSELAMFLNDTRVVDADAVRSAPYVVGFEEARLRATVGQNLYVRGLNAQPGQRWAIVRPTHEFRRFDAAAGHGPGELVAHDLDSDASMVNSPWREKFTGDGHYGHGMALGTEVSIVGSAEVLRGGDPSTLLLLDSTLEIRKGDRLMPVDDRPYDPYYYPHPPESLPVDARVIAFSDALDAEGSSQVVALSFGGKQGAENGQVYSIFEPGETIHDDIASNSARRSFGDDIPLPSEFVGHVMIFRTFDNVSYGLIMDGLKPVHLGNQLQLPN